MESYFQNRPLKSEHLSAELRELSERALKKAIKKLEEIVTAGPRYAIEGQSVHNTDLDAAKFLAKLAMDALKMSATHGSSTKKNAASALEDLFDRFGPWDLKKPG